jgi:hypothetical protein
VEFGRGIAVLFPFGCVARGRFVFHSSCVLSA